MRHLCSIVLISAKFPGGGEGERENSTSLQVPHHNEIILFSVLCSLWWVTIKATKKINSMSQSCRAHLFFGAHLIQQNSRFEIFFLLACLIFFAVFYELAYQNIHEKIRQTQ